MGTRTQRCVVLLATTAVCSLCYGDSRDLSLFARPVFEGLGVSALGSYPLLVDVANKGPNTRGNVVLTTESLSISYPVELPRGAKKQFIAYVPSASLYREASIALRTTQGNAAFNIRAPEEQGGEFVCMIGGSSGEMTFLRIEEEYPVYGLGLRDAYGRPGSLPDRSAGYSSFVAAVLGEGAERMTDDEVVALKDWVVSGGTLIFLGGAGNAMHNDARWRSFVPVREVIRENVRTLQRIDSIAGSMPPPGTITLAHGRPVDGAETLFSSGGRNLIVRKRIGLGHAVYLAFDPFQPPLKQWQGLRKLFINCLGQEGPGEAQNWRLTQSIGGRDQYYNPSFDAIDSPFEADLPSAGTVLLILVLHLIISVPLNFYVMRKIGKSELAWITTPIVSVAFAAVFFSLASDLYAAGQSTRSVGVLIAADGHPTGQFFGKSEIFVPRGGTYDLELKDVESIGGTSPGYYYENYEPLDATDDGSLHISDMRVGNLAFRELHLQQRVPVEDMLNVRAGKKGANTIELSIVNQTQYTLEGTTAQLDNQLYTVGDIGPGATFKQTLVGKKYSQAPWSGEPGIVIEANLKGFRPGPQLGVDVGSLVRLAYFGGTLK